VTRGQLPQRAGSLGLNGGGAAAAVPPHWTKGPPIGNDIRSIKGSRDRWRDPQRCREAVRSAILATAWLLVNTMLCDSVYFYKECTWIFDLGCSLRMRRLWRL